MRKIKPLGKGSFARKMLRALGKDSGFEQTFPCQEKKHLSVSVGYAHYGFHKELRNAMLEAERKKAKALMELQKRRFVC